MHTQKDTHTHIQTHLSRPTGRSPHWTSLTNVLSFFPPLCGQSPAKLFTHSSQCLFVSLNYSSQQCALKKKLHSSDSLWTTETYNYWSCTIQSDGHIATWMLTLNIKTESSVFMVTSGYNNEQVFKVVQWSCLKQHCLLTGNRINSISCVKILCCTWLLPLLPS